MSIFDDIFGGLSGFVGDAACLAWKANPLYWQALVGLHAAKAAGAITTKSACKTLGVTGSEVALRYGVPPIISGSLGGCLCDDVFSDDAAPAPVHSWTPRFDAIWEQVAPADTYVWTWSSDDFAKAHESLHAQGWRLIIQQAYDIGGGQLRYDGVWRQGSPEQQWVRGWASEDYRKKVDDMAAQGWGVVLQQVYDIGGGQLRYDGVWEQMGQQQHVFAWAPEDYAKQVDEMAAQGWRLIRQQVYDIGGGQLRYDGIWRREGLKIEQQWVRGWAPDDYGKQTDAMAAKGWRVVIQQSYNIGGGQLRYDAVWEQWPHTQIIALSWAPGDYIKQIIEAHQNGWRLVTQQNHDIG